MKQGLRKLSVITLAIAVLLGITRCSGSEQELKLGDKTQTNYQTLNDNLKTLNQEYSGPQTRAWKGWKFLAGGGADVVGVLGFLTKNVFQSIRASLRAYRYVKALTEDNNATVESVNDREDSMSSVIDVTNRIELTEDAYIHNLVILDLYDEYGEGLLNMNTDTLSNKVLRKVAEMKNLVIGDVVEDMESAEEELEAYEEALENSDDLDDYIYKLKVLCPDKSEELNVLRTIIEGFGNIEFSIDNGEYATKVIELIDNSELSDDEKNRIGEECMRC